MIFVEPQPSAVPAIGLNAQFSQFLVAPPVGVLVGAVTVLFFFLLLGGLLEFARQFDGDLFRVTEAGDQIIHHAAQLVEADMDGGVGNAAMEGGIVFFVGRVGTAGHDVAGEDRAIIGQAVENFAIAFIGMVPASALDGFVIGHNPAIYIGFVDQGREYFGVGGLAEPGIAVGQEMVFRAIEGLG